MAGQLINPIANTVFFPLTANPAGYHHLLLAECALRQVPDAWKVVFLLSNGRHPDPLKHQGIPDAEIRLMLFKQTLEDFNNPQTSYPGKLALESGSPLKMTKGKWEISTIEFRQQRPVRLAEHILRIRDKKDDADSSAGPDTEANKTSQRVRLLTGADLLFRMLDPRIFTDSDLSTIARYSMLLCAPRGDCTIDETLSQIRENRGVDLLVRTLDTSCLPQNLSVLFKLSSTIIRRAVQAGETLQSFMPESAAKLIAMQKLYLNETVSGQLNEWQQRCAELEKRLDKASHDLLKLLDRFQQNGYPHSLCLVETGGRIASALSAVPGASRHFVQGLVPYGREAQQQLLEDSPDQPPAVSRNRALALSVAGSKRSGADWTLAETGMAGPLSPKRHSRKNGCCYVALCAKTEPGPQNGTDLLFSHQFECNPFFSKKEHQLRFALHALEWTIQKLGPTP